MFICFSFYSSLRTIYYKQGYEVIIQVEYFVIHSLRSLEPQIIICFSFYSNLYEGIWNTHYIIFVCCFRENVLMSKMTQILWEKIIYSPHSTSWLLVTSIMIVVATATILPPLKVIRWCQWIMAKQKEGQIKWQTRRQTQQTQWDTQETQRDTQEIQRDAQETQLTRRRQGFYRPTNQNRAPPALLTKSDPRFGKLLIRISRKCFLFYYYLFTGVFMIFANFSKLMSGNMKQVWQSCAAMMSWVGRWVELVVY